MQIQRRADSDAPFPWWSTISYSLCKKGRKEAQNHRQRTVLPRFAGPAVALRLHIRGAIESRGIGRRSPGFRNSPVGIAMEGRAQRPPFEDDRVLPAKQLQCTVDSRMTQFCMGHGRPRSADEVRRHIATLVEV